MIEHRPLYFSNEKQLISLIMFYYSGLDYQNKILIIFENKQHEFHYRNEMINNELDLKKFVLKTKEQIRIGGVLGASFVEILEFTR